MHLVGYFHSCLTMNGFMNIKNIFLSYMLSTSFRNLIFSPHCYYSCLANLLKGKGFCFQKYSRNQLIRIGLAVPVNLTRAIQN